MSGRALVPVFIVGIICITVVVVLIVNKIKRRDPAARLDKRNAKLVFEANELFNEILDPTGNADTMSFLTEEHKKLVKEWKIDYRRVNG